MENNKIKELIELIENYYETGAIGYSLYIDLITKVRELQ